MKAIYDTFTTPVGALMGLKAGLDQSMVSHTYEKEVAAFEVIYKAVENGEFTEEEIETALKKWWDYWRTYWKLRGTKDAYPKDYVCEISIPVRED